MPTRRLAFSQISDHKPQLALLIALLARALVADALVQCREGSCIGRAREQLIAVDEMVERHRLLAQRVDHVPIIDNVAAGFASLFVTSTIDAKFQPQP